MEQVIQQSKSVTAKANDFFNSRKWRYIKYTLLFGTLYVYFSYLAYSWFFSPVYTVMKHDSIAYDSNVTVTKQTQEKPDETTRIPAEKINVVYADPNLVFVGLDPYFEGGRLTVIGKLENSNSFLLSKGVVHVSLFDQAGNIIYECDNQTGALNAFGGTSSVSVRCGCSKNPVPEFSSMQLTVY